MITKDILIAISCIMAIIMPIPMLRRIRHRGHTRDFSRVSAALLVAIQVNQGVIAIISHAHFFIFWYLMQTGVTLLQFTLIVKYWNYEEPRYRNDPSSTK